jgi:hypothetical protein
VGSDDGNRPVVALAAADAHGGVGRWSEDTGKTVRDDRHPDYEAASGVQRSGRLGARGKVRRPDARALFAAVGRERLPTIDAGRPGLLDFRRDRDALVARATMPRARRDGLTRRPGGRAVHG